MKKCLYCAQELIEEAGQCGRCGKLQSMESQAQESPLGPDKEIVEELETMRRILSCSK